MAEQFPMLWNKYVLLQDLDSGGMADVYLATYANNKIPSTRLVAIKRIRESHKEVHEWLGMFKNEVQLLLCLQSPNIVQTFDFELEGDEPFLVMEYVEGVGLKYIFSEVQAAKQFVDIPVCVEIINQTAAGLRDAHNFIDSEKREKNPIIHRDISPHNLIVGSNGIVKIVDFGIAKSSVSDYKTLINQIKGKPGYMSPEQILGEKVDARTDIFSLGICFWELLAGKKLFPADKNDYGSILRFYQTKDYAIPDPSTLNKKIDAELTKIVGKMLQISPAARYSSMDEVEEAIKQYQKNTGIDAGATLLKSYLEKNFADYLTLRKDAIQVALKNYKDALKGGGLRQKGVPGPDDSTVLMPMPDHPRKKYTKFILAFSSFAFVLLLAAYFYNRSDRTPLRSVQGVAENNESNVNELNRQEKMRLSEIHDLKVKVEDQSSEKVKAYLESFVGSGEFRERRLNFLSLNETERMGILNNVEKAFAELLKGKSESEQLKIIEGAGDSLKKLPPMRRGNPQR